jgi:hypothetical protein
MGFLNSKQNAGPTGAKVTVAGNSSNESSVSDTHDMFQKSQGISSQRPSVANTLKNFQTKHSQEIQKNPILPSAAPKQSAGTIDRNKETSLSKSESLVRESAERRMDFMERKILSTVIYKSLVEGMFREEKKASEWDQYIGKLSKQALAGDHKFQNLQKGISKKEDAILGDAFDTISKATRKIAKLKNFGVKKDGQTGKTYLAFGAEFDGANVEPIIIHIENGTPSIEVSQNARVALTKIEPSDAKMFRAELVTVQEEILDEMDDLNRAVANRDKYLQKLEGGVDAYVSGLSPLQVSLLKNLLIKKYRKIS